MHTHKIIRRHLLHLLQGLITLQQNLMMTGMEGCANWLLMTTDDNEQLSGSGNLPYSPSNPAEGVYYIHYGHHNHMIILKRKK